MDPAERLREETEETLSFFRNNGLTSADVGIILGFGLEKASQFLTSARGFDLQSIPNFPVILSYGYGKKLLFSEFSDKKVVLLEGHFNLFEGYTARSVAYPVWILSQLGVKVLLYLTEGFALEDKDVQSKLVLARDYLSFIDENPLSGITEGESVMSLKPASEVYSKELARILAELLEEKKAVWGEGVIAFKRGPVVETPAEARFLKKTGADLVCYSGYPETIIATALGLKFASLIVVNGKATNVLSSEKRLAIAKDQVPLVKDVLKKFIRKVDVNGV